MLTRPALRAGLTLERTGPALTQEAFSAFGRLLGTDAPIHDDPAYACATGFKGTIAQGMLLAAPYETWLCEIFGEAAWLRGGKLSIRLRSPAWVGDQVRMTLCIREIGESACTLEVESRCGGRSLLTGSASLVLGP